MESAIAIAIFLLGAAWVLASTRKKKWSQLTFWIVLFAYGYLSQSIGAVFGIKIARNYPTQIAEAETFFLWVAGGCILALCAISFINWANSDE